MLINDALDVFRKGKSVANPVLWKSIGATSSMLAGLITSGLAVAAAFGYPLPLGDDLVQALAGGVAAALFVFGGGLHVATTDKIGLPAKRNTDEPADDAGSNDAGFDIFKGGA